MVWRPWFEPRPIEEPAPVSSGPTERDDGRVYVYTDEVVVAINVAWATGRPLLLRGSPGTGKSTLAKNVAKILGRAFEEIVVTSRTQKEDLLWKFDAVRRLADAQIGSERAQTDEHYVIPGPLWWAFDPRSAKEHLEQTGQHARLRHRSKLGLAAPEQQWVLLIDEIDKADPDVPNDLLGPLGSMKFWVEPLGRQIEFSSSNRSEGLGGEKDGDATLLDTEKKRPLVFITTNEERELPRAFIRRCVVIHLHKPSPTDLLKIAKLHFEHAINSGRIALAGLEILAKRFVDLRDVTKERELSTAEFIDAVDAVIDLGLGLEDEDHWRLLAGVALRKLPDKP